MGEREGGRVTESALYTYVYRGVYKRDLYVRGWGKIIKTPQSTPSNVKGLWRGVGRSKRLRECSKFFELVGQCRAD